MSMKAIVTKVTIFIELQAEKMNLTEKYITKKLIHTVKVILLKMMEVALQ